ncbi:hypothetical protein SAMN04489761_3729 [Tenacibaculum sp. MAR_2009_124]|uniref:LA_2272 family surface repeat-containing protein n=1 Tax=Tenacibaculum sp. MAR_2009_124 TaxID=1250059 RepID=UPI000899ACDB|nr:hypothetical protein [Tenacibaculum sp. MAR_2009_124]SEC83787.1 hypothetical protein SAMN04489761_3729 [Tenacibaculum sp. MAR_2009_124]
MKTYLSFSMIFLFLSSCFSQKRKLRFPAWITHSESTDIIGLSLGLLPKPIFKDTTLTRTYGIRIEAPGLGFLMPLIPRSPISTNDEAFYKSLESIPVEKVYGLNISSGSVSETQIYGISIALIGQYFIKMNGISIAGFGNLIQKQNGISIGIFGNDTYLTNGASVAVVGTTAKYINGLQIGGFNKVKQIKGIQIGIFNKAKNLKGFQIGLWNKNKKRSFPLINWNF